MAAVRHHDDDFEADVRQPVSPEEQMLEVLKNVKKFTPEETYELRNSSFSFSIPSIQRQKYFDKKNIPHPTNVHAIGLVDRFPRPETEEKVPWGFSRPLVSPQVLWSNKKKNKKNDEDEKERKRLEEIEKKKVHEDPTTSNARHARLANFQDLANASVDVRTEGGDVFDFLQGQFKVVNRIAANEIQGIPSLPSNVRMQGAIELAIVVPVKQPDIPNNGLPRLLIAAAEGVKLVRVSEAFAMDRLEPYGCFAMCCSQDCSSFCCPCCNSADYSVEYEIGQTFKAHFVDIPLVNTVVDAVAIKEVDRKLTAHAGKESDPDCIVTCCNCYEIACCTKELCCFAMCCCGLCSCNCCNCGFKTVNYWDKFNAEEKHVMDKEPPQDKRGKTASNGVAWNMELAGTDITTIKVHYVPATEPILRTMSLKIKESPKAFHNAKQFVAALGTHRSTTPSFKLPTASGGGFSRAGGEAAVAGAGSSFLNLLYTFGKKTVEEKTLDDLMDAAETGAGLLSNAISFFS